MLELARRSEYLSRIGLRELSPVEEASFAFKYREELLAGARGEPRSVAMSPTLVSPVPLDSLREGSQAVVAEIGGTNLYAARVIVRDGRPTIVYATEKELPTVKFDSANDFYAMVADNMQPVLEQDMPEPDAIGFVYSFPGVSVHTPNGVGVLSPEKLPKDYVIPGISQREVGGALLDMLNDKFGVDQDLPTVVINDTGAVLLSANAKIGGVVGTGYNLAMQTPIGMVSSESGGFNFPLSHDLARRVDEQSGNPGKQLAEKQASGLYMGKQMGMIVADTIGSMVATPTLEREATGKLLTDILRFHANDPKVDTMKEGARMLRDRSAQIVGIMIGTAMNTFPEIFLEQTHHVPIEGSFFWRVPGYEQGVKEVAERVSGKKVVFQNIKNAGRLGAGVAALSLVR